MKIKSIRTQLKEKKILRIKKLPQIKFSENTASKKLLCNKKLGKNCFPQICTKSGKFKKGFKLFRINRWVFLNESRKNNLPNLRKYVW